MESEGGLVYIKLNHNIELAHRLFLMPGKCQQIHGHSMKVELTLYGHPNDDGVFEGLDFADVKKKFRDHLNKEYDHRLLLHVNDPWAQPLIMEKTIHEEYHPNDETQDIKGFQLLPGLVICIGDPTTENLAMWIGNWAFEAFDLGVDVYIQETGSNGVGFSRR
jgi:6-pyruvoyl-tetrahydropterin synthase